MILLIFIIGICLGSFLNVVIYRLPREQGIVFSASHCVLCHKKLKWFHNIPLMSYIFLKGRCAFCLKKISCRYIWVELITGLVMVFLFYNYGFQINILFIKTVLFSLILISLIFIDLEHQILPDNLNFLLLWAGLLLSTVPRDAIIGAAAGYVSLWLIANSYKLITGREGMGYGDLKLLAALGAWVGWQRLPMVVLIAALLGSIVAVVLIASKKATGKTAIAFGPYLAIAGWSVLLFSHFPL